MKAKAMQMARVLFLAAVLVGLAVGLTGRASAAGAGWYGPAANGCYDWSNDGVYATGYIFCPSGTGAGNGWYGPMTDGCFYDWEFTGWTGAKDCFVNGIEYFYPAPSSAASAQVSTNADGSQTIIYADGTVVTVPASSDDCGNDCQTNPAIGTGNQSGDIGIWVNPRTQQEYTPGCEIVREGYCYSTYP